MTRGGYRPGAGRKPSAAPKLRRITLVLTESERQELRDAAGADPLAAWSRARLLELVRSE